MTQRNPSASRPSLLPASVPWQVSASAAFVRVDRTELSTTGIVRIDFVGFFGGRTWPSGHHSGTTVEVVNPPSNFTENPAGVVSKYHQVRVVFEYVQACRISPAISDSQCIDESAYDWGAIPDGLLPGEGVRENVERVRKLWLNDGVCPNPRMYEVAPSIWKAELGLQGSGFVKHYLLAGTDEFVEVLAQGWKWILGDPVR